jgi:hypothetical protein
VTHSGKFDARFVALPDHVDRLSRVLDGGTEGAGVAHLRVAILGWWLGQERAVADSLDVAIRWLDAAGDERLPSEEDAPAHVARHGHARALAHLLAGDDRAELWAAAAQAHRTALRGLDRAGRAHLAPGAMLCNAMADGELPPHLTLTGDLSLSVLDILSAATDPVEAGRRLYGARDILFADEPGLSLTTLFAFVFMRQAGLGSVETALRAGYALDPDLSLPPEIEAEGWTDRDEAVVVLAPAAFDRLAGLLPLLGLARDTDAVAQGALPEFASWTRHPDLSLEADWHAPPGQEAYLEIRGRGAGRLAAFLAEALGGTPRLGPEAALTELLTVPQRAAPADSGAAEARWEMLCVAVAVAGEGVFDDLPGRALVSAALADSDWRVRMVALWAVGHHRMGGLAAKAEAAALPAPGYEGLSQDDRRVLLALRDLAAARSAGRADPVKPGANAGFVARVAALIDRVPRMPNNRAEALVMALLRRPAPKGAPLVPSAWKRWMAPSSL